MYGFEFYEYRKSSNGVSFDMVYPGGFMTGHAGQDCSEVAGKILGLLEEKCIGVETVSLGGKVDKDLCLPGGYGPVSREFLNDLQERLSSLSSDVRFVVK